MKKLSILVFVTVIAVFIISCIGRKTISGEIFSNNGKLTGIPVYAISEDIYEKEGDNILFKFNEQKEYYSAFTNAEGKFSIRVPAGKYRIIAASDKYGGYICPVDATYGNQTISISDRYYRQNPSIIP